MQNKEPIQAEDTEQPGTDMWYCTYCKTLQTTCTVPSCTDTFVTEHKKSDGSYCQGSFLKV